MRNIKMSAFFLCLMLIVIGSSCSSGESESEPADQAQVPDSTAEKLKTVMIDVQIPVSEETLVVKAQIPAGWVRNPDFGGAVFQPEDYADYFYAPVIQYQASCAGPCDPKAIPGNIDKTIQGIKETLSRPNINTGDPELDAVRANVDILADEKFSEDGWILAAAVTYPENLSAALYIPKIVVHSFRHHEGDGFFVQTTALAELNQKEELLPLFLEACKKTDYGPSL
ncbi:MAG: hypothetical protein JXB23_18725 [Candidatus Aminicenantes bacterium]|nr:hypothetical protein [Candidatus Aminicenantes bacterium]